MSTPHLPSELSGRPIGRLPLTDLLLDPNNPRFGSPAGGINQRQILDRIVDKFGVNDVLSSIAVNGYFDAEPLVCREDTGTGKAVVVEGNRRLAACLIIMNDPRASGHAKRTKEFSQLWAEHGRRPIDHVPVMVFDAAESDEEKALLSYLGVRHIVSSQPWDSYAKAAWVARVVETEGLNIADVSRMIGDQHRTVTRLVEGYYLVKQLTESGHFRPEDSIRRGRGSVTDYPFSWVYTVLGYKTVREFLQLSDGDAHRDLLAVAQLQRGGLLLRSMFGDRSKARNAAIEDSRQLGDFAALFSDRHQVRLLEHGKALTEIEDLTQPIGKRLSIGLGQVLDILRDLHGRLPETNISPEAAEDLTKDTTTIRNLAVDLDKRMQKLAAGGGDEGA